MGEDEEQRCPLVMWSLRYSGRCSVGEEKRQDSEDIMEEDPHRGQCGELNLGTLRKKVRWTCLYWEEKVEEKSQ